MEALNPRVRWLWIGQAILFGVVVGLIVAAVDRWVVDLPTWGLATTVGVVLVLGVAYSVRLYQRWSFEVQADALYLERGVVTFVETSVPFVRVQHVDTQFGPVERAFGLSSLVVYTAGSRNADVRIPGLTPDRARELQNSLRELATESEIDDAV